METLAGMARAGYPRAAYERARRRLKRALENNDEPAVRQWLVEYETPRMGAREDREARQRARSERQAQRQGQRATRRSERGERRAQRSAARTERAIERQTARTGRAVDRAVRREVREEQREQRRELRPDRPGLDLSQLEQTGGRAVSWLRDQAQSLLGERGEGGEQTQVSALERERSVPVVPIVLGVAVIGGGAWYFMGRKRKGRS